MNETELYKTVTELQDVLTEQRNLLVSILEDLEAMAVLFEQSDEPTCPKCGGNEVMTKGDDAIDWCAECGVIEGLL